MRRNAMGMALALLLALLPAGSATGKPESILVQKGPGVGGFMSPNVEYVGTIPIDSPGVGGRMVKVGNQTRFYVTGLKGLTIYDVTDPSLPVPIGVYPYYHSQNEDVDVSDDGKRVIISADGSLLVPIAPQSVGIHVIDTSDLSDIKEIGMINASNHTTTCADAACEWLYGSNGRIYDATFTTNPTAVVDTGVKWKPSSGSAHALNRDAAGLMVSDTNPRLVLDPREDPAHPRIIAQGFRNGPMDNKLQHNNVRPRADEWVPRDPASADYNDLTLRPGELLIGNSESNLNNACAAAGGLSTWSMRNFDQGKEMYMLDSFLPRNGDWNTNGDPARNALGCSGHWFTERNNMVAAGWYEHGIRFFSIDPTDGFIQQAGFFNPVVTEASAAHWVTDAAGNEYVYSVDYARGIDILRFDRSASAPTRKQTRASWVPTGYVGTFASAERYYCELAMKGEKGRPVTTPAL